MSLEVRQIHPMFDAEASGIDLRRAAGSALVNPLLHRDSSFQQTPGNYSMLSAVIVPPRQRAKFGETRKRTP